MIEQFPDKNSIDLKYNTDQDQISAAISKTLSNFSKESIERSSFGKDDGE
jgi:hypothetical protein